MDTSFVEFNDDDDDCRSSSESSVGFSFSTAMNLKKNLTEAFDKQVDISNERSSKESHCGSTDSLSVVDRIAQFEVASSHASKPPRPVRPPSNIVPKNRLAVYLRIRPPRQSDTQNNSQQELSTIDVLKPKHPTIYPKTVRTYPPLKPKSHSNRESDVAAKEFEFNQVLEPQTTQKALYSTVAAPMVQSLFDSYLSEKKPSKRANESALLFSYGITNAGKTHTILGDVKSKNEAKWGVIPRAITDVFDRIKQLPITAGHFDPYISIFEIYNENICDLVPKKSKVKHYGPTPTLQVRERNGQTVVRGLTRHKVKDASHGIDLVIAANNKRHTSSNNLNSGSSRSHCVCQIQIVPRTCRFPPTGRCEEQDDDASVVSMSGYSTDEEVNHFAKSNLTLWIVDLAGSERSKRTGLDNSQRQKESSLINKSLMTLMRCLTVMRETGRQSSSSVVPYRESKLTHVFMSHLNGKSASRTAMVVNVNPSIADFDETQHVLSYASQARLIQMDPEDMDKKRKLCYGEEYDMNGRKKAKLTSLSTASQARNMFSKVAKKLSPKKLVKKLSPRNKAKAQTKKRPAGFSKQQMNGKPPARRPTFDEPVRKRMKYPLKQSRDAHVAAPGNKEVELLQNSLSAAQSEVEKLRTEKRELAEELQKQETQIRTEVAEEMEECLRVTRERNQEELNKLRSQLRAKDMPCRSTRKARMDKAEQYIEDLVDKVHECEEEMVRMRSAHAEEIAALKNQLRHPTTGKTDTPAESKKVAELEKELAATKEQITRLEKSKVELIENYEKLLGEEEGEDDESLENNEPASRRKTLRSSKRHNKHPQTVSSQSNAAEPRPPLGTISNTDRTNQVAKGESWIFPTKPSSRDGNGTYKKPIGKVPSGREWDRTVGAWRLKSVNK